MFINLTNHSSKNWSADQLSAATQYGDVEDFPFPDISPKASAEDVLSLAQLTIEKISEYEPECVLCQGEFTFVYEAVRLMRSRNIHVVAACSERKVDENIQNGETVKTVTFKFCGFREYI